MAEFSNIKFSGSDVIKGIGFLIVVGGMWSDLKTDQVKTRSQIEFLQYQINELKPNSMVAIKPKKTEIESK